MELTQNMKRCLCVQSPLQNRIFYVAQAKPSQQLDCASQVCSHQRSEARAGSLHAMEHRLMSRKIMVPFKGWFV